MPDAMILLGTSATNDPSGSRRPAIAAFERTDGAYDLATRDESADGQRAVIIANQQTMIDQNVQIIALLTAINAGGIL